MTSDLTPDIEKIFEQQIWNIAESNGRLIRTALLGDHGQDQHIVLVFDDSRWAMIQPTSTTSNNGWQHKYINGLHIVGQYCDEHHCYRHQPTVDMLLAAGLCTVDQWQAQQDLETRQWQESLAESRRLEEERKVAAKEKAEQNKQQRLEDEFHKALRLKYGCEATDRGLKQLRSARNR